MGNDVFLPPPSRSNGNRLATVKSSVVSNKVTVRFDGDEADSPQGFVVASGLSLSVSDRVLMIPAGKTWVVALKLAA